MPRRAAHPLRNPSLHFLSLYLTFVNDSFAVWLISYLITLPALVYMAPTALLAMQHHWKPGTARISIANSLENPVSLHWSLLRRFALQIPITVHW